jgi:hypothetical protein
LRRLRLSVAALLGVAIAALVWAVPWLRIGMSSSDLSPAAIIEIVLLLVLWLGTAAAALRWAPLLTDEPRSELLRALMGERLSIRGRQRFLLRLRYQLQQSLRGRRRIFSLAVLTLPSIDRSTPEGEGVMDGVLHAARRVIRTADVLGDSEQDEVWMLLAEAGPQACESVCARLAERLHGTVESGGRPAAQLGWASFEIDGRDSATLFRVARQRSMPLTDLKSHTAAA